MAEPISLHELIVALTGAVTEAQDAIQQHQLGAIGRYFDVDGHPLAYAFQLPNPSHDVGQPPHRKVVVPLLSLVEPNLLAISEFAADFRVELGSLAGVGGGDADEGRPTVAAAAASRPERTGAPIDIPRPPSAGAPEGAAADLWSDEEAPVDAAGALPSVGRAPPPMTVAMAGPAQAGGPVANLSIKVVSRPVAEGMSRLVTALNQTI